MSQPSTTSEMTSPVTGARSGGRGGIIVTGASSGIGRSAALHLLGEGYRVYAGVRNEADAASLKAEAPGIDPVMLDVRNAEHIAALVRLIDQTEPQGLVGLVNNAGVGVVGPMEDLPVEDWDHVMGVNVVGVAAMIRAFLPSLLKSRGRVINIGSGSGRVAFPLFGPYVASKFALEGLTDVLRREVQELGVKVILVQPGIIATPIYDKSLPAAYARTERLDPVVAKRYERLIKSAHSSAEEAGQTGAPAIVVAEAVARAMEDKRPKTRYVVGTDARAAVVLARLLPDRVIDFVIRRLTAN